MKEVVGIQICGWVLKKNVDTLKLCGQSNFISTQICEYLKFGGSYNCMYSTFVDI